MPRRDAWAGPSWDGFTELFSRGLELGVARLVFSVLIIQMARITGVERSTLGAVVVIFRSRRRCVGLFRLGHHLFSFLRGGVGAPFRRGRAASCALERFLSAATKSAPTFCGMPMLDLPALAICIATRCFRLVLGIISYLLSHFCFVGQLLCSRSSSRPHQGMP